MVEGYTARIAAPFAVLGIRTSGGCLTQIEYLPRSAATLQPVDAFATEVCRQLEAYLDDPQFRFDLPVWLRGTQFQQRVWAAVREIPVGLAMSYADVARRVDSAPRAVGTACGANRLPLIIPCHRVVASGGIGGFMHSRTGPGIQIKRWLLRHEGAVLER
jgi:methylated-DNA-[protein]-cysteine S-methyltransferase